MHVPKIKRVRFDLYRAVIMLKKNYDRQRRQATEKIEALEAIPVDDWSPNQRRSHLLWKTHQQELREAEEAANSPWVLQDVINAAIDGSIPDTIMDYQGEKIEIDRNACYQKEKTPWLTSFQISRLRADSLPAKKKIGMPRDDIHLEDDEYIGEFTEVILDSRYNIIIIQANRYGVGVGVVCKYLNYLQKKYDELNGIETAKYVIGALQPIIDEELTRKAFESEYIHKIRIRCSDENVEAFISDDNESLGSVARLIGEQTGIVLDVTLSVKGREHSRTLKTEDIRRAGQEYVRFINDPNTPDGSKKDARMEFTIWNETESIAESVDLMIPKVNFIIPLSVEERQPIGSEYLYDLTAEEYNKLTSRITALIGG